MKIVHVSGARGVGKTTVLQELERRHGDELNVCSLHSSTVLSDLSRETYKKTLAELEEKELVTVQEKTIAMIKGMPFEIVLLDGHNVKVDFSSGKVTILTPEKHKREFDCHILMEADPQVIRARRVADCDVKIKREFSLDSIKMEIDEERAAAHRIAEDTGTSLYVVENRDLIRSVDEIREILVREFKVVLRR